MMKHRSIALGFALMFFAMWGIVTFCFQRHHPPGRLDAATVVLNDGRVLLAGGDRVVHHFRWIDIIPPLARERDNEHRVSDYFPPRPDVSDCDIFDPKTETWSATGSLAQADSHMNLILLKKGTVFGMGESGVAQIYESGSWRLVRALVAGDICAPLPSGEVLVVGTKKCLIYDPQTDKWRIAASVGPLSKPFIQSLKDGRVLLIDDTSDERPLMLYDPKQDKWTPSLPFILPQPWKTFSPALLPDGGLFICGTVDRDNRKYGPTSVFFDLQVKEWHYVFGMPETGGTCQAVALQDSRVLVADDTPSSCLYDPKSERWSPTGASGPLQDPETHFTMVRLLDGRVLAVGFYVTQLYDPHTGVWKVVQDGRKSSTTLDP